MSERAFHMTPAQAEAMRAAVQGGVSWVSRFEIRTALELRKNEWVTRDWLATDAGREALQRYEEGRA